MVLTLYLKDADWLNGLKQQDQIIYCLQETHLTGKTDFKPKLVSMDKDHYILIKGIIHQEDITILNIPNVDAPNFIKQTLHKGPNRSRYNSSE
jgi:hypothetical protein